MARPRSRTLDYLAYLAVRAAVGFMQMLPDEAARGLAHGLGRIGYWLDKRHRRVADENLRHAFPDLSESDRDRLVRGCFAHFASLVIEIARLPRKLHLGN